MKIPEKMLKNFCRINHISKLSFFGSSVTNPETAVDIDILVEFDEGSKPGLLDMARLERELSEIFKKKVDLRTPEELSRLFREEVIKEAKVEYSAKG
ncbi:MAG TPA: nucleotidyltransferase domain-containing protein [Ignavibacteriaceae bacterium]|nr:nucleotidyltransferase domain-containing protein [Ignavibacteriaceae bacterium]